MIIYTLFFVTFFTCSSTLACSFSSMMFIDIINLIIIFFIVGRDDLIHELLLRYHFRNLYLLTSTLETRFSKCEAVRPLNRMIVLVNDKITDLKCMEHAIVVFEVKSCVDRIIIIIIIESTCYCKFSTTQRGYNENEIHQ